MKVGRFATALLVSVFLFSLLVLAIAGRYPGRSMFGISGLADDSGFLALGLIAATAVLMLFKKPLAEILGSPERLWRVHIVVAWGGGLFLGIHVVLFLAFPLSLPVFLGYIATGAALFVWLTGGVFFQGVRNSMFYHGVFSIGAIFLMILHTFGAGRNIPMDLSGVSLVLIGLAVVAGVAFKLAKAWRAEAASSVGPPPQS